MTVARDIVIGDMMVACMYVWGWCRHSRASISMDTVSSAATTHSTIVDEVKASCFQNVALYVVCMYVRNDACIIDGRLAEVHAGADIQGEEGSEEDAARAEHAGQGDICSDSYYCTLILYMHELTEQVRCRHQRKGTKDVCGRFAQTHIYIHTYIHTYMRTSNSAGKSRKGSSGGVVLLESEAYASEPTLPSSYLEVYKKTFKIHQSNKDRTKVANDLKAAANSNRASSTAALDKRVF